MLRVIAYDIREPKRLKRVAKCCERFGVRIEKSVFESRLGNERFQAFWNQLCEEGIKTAGQLVRPDTKEVYVL